MRVHAKSSALTSYIHHAVSLRADGMARDHTARIESQHDRAEQSTGGVASRVDTVPATPETPSQPSDMPMSNQMRDHIQV